MSPPRKRRRDGGDHDSRASKKQADGRASSAASAVAQLSCARIRQYVRESRPKEEQPQISAGNDAHVVITKQQESGERVQAIATASIPQLARQAPPSSIPKDPIDPDNEFRAALAAARRAIVRRRREEARRERDKVVQTVYFNDPNMTLENLLKAQALIGSC